MCSGEISQVLTFFIVIGESSASAMFTTRRAACPVSRNAISYIPALDTYQSTSSYWDSTHERPTQSYRNHTIIPKLLSLTVIGHMSSQQIISTKKYDFWLGGQENTSNIYSLRRVFRYHAQRESYGRHERQHFLFDMVPLSPHVQLTIYICILREPKSMNTS